MSALYALYGDGDAAQRAVDALRRAGCADADITVASAEPMEHHEFGGIERETSMWSIAAAGGVAGLAFGTLLTWYTEVAWPLPTGNMPIVAWWPNLIIMFELTMLGGILSAVATLLVSARLPARRAGLYDPAVMDGNILVGVDNPTDPAVIERALAGGEVRRV